MKQFEQIEHTADVGIKVYGKDLTELFANAALGMFSVISDLKCFKAKSDLKITLEAQDYEELLAAWLRELLFQYSTKDYIFIKFDIKNLSENKITAVASFCKVNKRECVKKDIKAVTYHDLHIKQVGGHYEAQIIFDV